ncbi:hypothetical protein [Botrimarina sp.]|uniref:hypothetical protein n=1 Tax=Botrimarina sp. TaxID=2795802 RepID=UPI0032ECC709
MNLYYAFAGIIAFATFAMMVREGIWNNLINTIAIVIGGLTAFGVHQPLVVMLDERLGGSYTYLLDFPVLWGVFALVTGVLKQLANQLSDTRVSFPDEVDNYGGAAIGLLGAYAMTGFGLATFHTAPLSYDLGRNAYAMGVTASEAEQSLSDASGPLRPDVVWLGLVDYTMNPARLGEAGFSAPLWVAEHGRHRQAFESIQETAVKRS